jgi:hypothetical protein
MAISPVSFGNSIVEPLDQQIYRKRAQKKLFADVLSTITGKDIKVENLPEIRGCDQPSDEFVLESMKPGNI